MFHLKLRLCLIMVWTIPADNLEILHYFQCHSRPNQPNFIKYPSSNVLFELHTVLSYQPELHCNDITQEIDRYQPIYASAILSFKGMWCWLDLHIAVEKCGRLGPWPYLISIWQSEVTVTMLHVYSRLKFYNASMSLMHICPMLYADFYVDGSDNRT